LIGDPDTDAVRRNEWKGANIAEATARSVLFNSLLGAGVARIARVNPSYSIEQRRKVLPYKNPADFERFVEGLRKAGPPEE
jgi:hypothetical protein